MLIAKERANGREKVRITGDTVLNKRHKDGGSGAAFRTQAEGPPLNRGRGLFML